MKKGWEMKTLGDLYDITSSKRVFESEWKRSGVPFYRAREIVKLARQGFVDNELYISEEMYNQYSEKYGIPKEGDIMVTGVGTLGICYVVKKNDRFYFKDGNIIWLKKNSDINSRFVEYAFQSDFLRKQIDDSVGATVGTFTIIKAKNTLIPIPPLPEQQRIVSVLDEALASIAQAKSNAERNLVNARELFESVLEGYFGNGKDWEEKKLGDVLQKTETIDPTKTPNKEYVYIDVSSVNKENLSIEEVNLIKGKDAPSRARKLIKTNDVIFATVRPTLRRIAIVPEEYDNQICSTGYFVLRGKEFIDNRLIFYFLQTNGFMTKMEKLQKGASYPAVTDGEVRDQIIHYPKSLTEQRAIVGRLEALSAETGRLEEIYQQKVESLEELKKSVLAKAFEGEL